MPYKAALEKSWRALSEKDFLEIEKAAGVIYKPEDNCFSLKFFSEVYQVYPGRKLILISQKPAPEFVSILILHYLSGAKPILPPAAEWLTFNQLESGQFYYPAFYKRALKPLIDEFGTRKKNLLSALKVLEGEKIELGDLSVKIMVFAKFDITVVIWYGDEELSPSANILFDKHTADFFVTEDLAVLGGMAAKYLLKYAQ